MVVKRNCRASVFRRRQFGKRRGGEEWRAEPEVLSEPVPAARGGLSPAPGAAVWRADSVSYTHLDVYKRQVQQVVVKGIGEEFQVASCLEVVELRHPIQRFFVQQGVAGR